jgi:iron(III) transport system substrate-binding protein
MTPTAKRDDPRWYPEPVFRFVRQRRRDRLRGSWRCRSVPVFESYQDQHPKPDRHRPLVVLAVLLLLAGCRRAPDVVLYVSADDHVARRVVKAFEAHTGLRVATVGDLEQVKTTGLVNRLRSEADHPQADVFWSSEVFHTVNLAREGVLEPYVSDALADWPAAFRDPQHRWYGFAARARVIVFAPDRVAPEARPRTWMDLTQPRFKGRIVMADPRFGTTGGHLAAMQSYWTKLVGPAYYDAFLMGLADNDVRLLPSGNAGVVQAVADGEADLGLTDTDDVWAARARGLDVDLVYPRHDAAADDSGGGTLLIPNTVARVRGGPHPEAAGRLIEFLLSAEVARMLAGSVSHNVPVRADLAADYPEFAVADPLRVDYARAAAGLQGAVERAMARLGRGGDAR